MEDFQLIRRLEAILFLIKEHQPISKQKLEEKLLEGYDIVVSERTFRRSLDKLRNDFQIWIKYNHQKQGYELEDISNDRFESFLKFTGQLNLGALLNRELKDLEFLEAHLDINQDTTFRGFEQIRRIMLCIKGRHDISFVHENYYEGTQKPYRITPFKIKEYLNRWYVMGVPSGSKEIRIFGIDRISHLKVAPGSGLKIDDFQKQLVAYDNVVGLTCDQDKKPEKVVLSVHHKQMKYLEALPLHQSQQIELNEGDEFGLATFTLIPNYELKQEILKMNFMVEVLEPVWLRENINDILLKTQKNYQPIKHN